MSEIKEIKYNNRTISTALGLPIDIEEATGDIHFENVSYTFTKFETNNTATFNGKVADNKDKTVIIMENSMDINEEGHLIFKDLTFIQDPHFTDAIRFTDKCMFNIKGKAEFINCDFFGFDDEFMFLLRTQDSGSVSFTNCNFDGVLGILQTYSQSVASFNKCNFRNIQQEAFFLTSDETCTFTKCKAEIYNGSFITLRGVSKCSLDSCSFNGIFVGESYYDEEEYKEAVKGFEEKRKNLSKENNYSELYIGDRLIEKMSATEQTINVVDCGDQSVLQANKCSFSDMSIAILATETSKISLLECKFKKAVTTLALANECVANIYSSSFLNGERPFVYSTESSIANIYDSTFKGCEVAAVFASDNSQISIYDSTVTKNQSHGILAIDDANIKVHHCDVSFNKATGIHSDGNAKGDVAKCNIYDNDIFNILICGNSDFSFENNDIYYRQTKVKDFCVAIICIQDKAKVYFENNRINGIDHLYNAFHLTDTCDVFVKECKIKKVDLMALLNDSSKLYLKDCEMDLPTENVAKGQEDSQFNMVGCDIIHTGN